MYRHVIHSKIELRLSNLVGECWGLFPDRTNGTSHCIGLLACYLHCHPCDLAAHCGKLHAWAQMSYTQSAVKPAIWLTRPYVKLTWNKKNGLPETKCKQNPLCHPSATNWRWTETGVLGCLKHRDGFVWLCQPVMLNFNQLLPFDTIPQAYSLTTLNDVKGNWHLMSSKSGRPWGSSDLDSRESNWEIPGVAPEVRKNWCITAITDGLHYNTSYFIVLYYITLH